MPNPADNDERTTYQRFRDYYAGADAPVIRELERRSLGADFGGNSYTTVDQADHLEDLLELGPESWLLDVGSGAGWPGLYLAQQSGCRAVLTDLPIEGLRLATARAATDEIRAAAVATSGTELPFRAGAFDAVSHSDVLC